MQVNVSQIFIHHKQQQIWTRMNPWLALHMRVIITSKLHSWLIVKNHFSVVPFLNDSVLWTNRLNESYWIIKRVTTPTGVTIYTAERVSEHAQTQIITDNRVIQTVTTYSWHYFAEKITFYSHHIRSELQRCCAVCLPQGCALGDSSAGNTAVEQNDRSSDSEIIAMRKTQSF